MVWSGKAGDRRLKLFIHIEQRGWGSDTWLYGKRQPVRLVWAVIRILTQDNDFYLTQFRITKRVKHIFLRRVNGHPGLALVRNRLQGVYKIGLLFFVSKDIVPG
ncbi:Uncharacterised protein [Yokenella regensburgei]|nr:Uncharacterised protein [Yokenella regensburgei]